MTKTCENPDCIKPTAVTFGVDPPDDRVVRRVHQDERKAASAEGVVQHCRARTTPGPVKGRLLDKGGGKSLVHR